MPDTVIKEKVAFLVAEVGIERMELVEPWIAVAESGYEPILVATVAGRVQAFDDLDPSVEFGVDHVVDDVEASDFRALVIPGGVVNSDRLRTERRAIEFVRGFFALGAPVAAICHAPWNLIEAGVLGGRSVTSWPSLRTDIVNAGARWKDQPSVICREGASVLITGRGPEDLLPFCSALAAELCESNMRVR